jgi:hypothetical protein
VRTELAQLDGDRIITWLLSRIGNAATERQQQSQRRIGRTVMDEDTKRRLVYGLLSLILGAIATRLAMYLTNRILGEPEDGVV